MATRRNRDIFLGGFANLFIEQWQVDLRLKAGDSKKGEAISVHKLVMAATSEVFKKILESDKFKASDGKIETITLFELKQEPLEGLVEFIYDNSSVLSEKEKKHVQSLYIAGDKYEILHLRELCRNELIASLDPSNALNVLELSLIPFDEALNDSAASFIIMNLETICETAEFKAFVRRNPDLSVEIMKASYTRMWNGRYVN
ncbi:PREDICTED: putative BTB/POZ domain-containing protein At2g40440 [Camelina sativa]|uniref:BTB/POZ domain-containing protein At2g40440 n=1 Tax=Camelina sativa TaxID=90675 RepID=A0ABM0T188_CAMSA|nr:PREDICTED: putative BTB/POZ domain-containing protein At2g40440 [Camelina sativa]